MRRSTFTLNQTLREKKGSGSRSLSRHSKLGLRSKRKAVGVKTDEVPHKTTTAQTELQETEAHRARTRARAALSVSLAAAPRSRGSALVRAECRPRGSQVRRVQLALLPVYSLLSSQKKLARAARLCNAAPNAVATQPLPPPPLHLRPYALRRFGCD